MKYARHTAERPRPWIRSGGKPCLLMGRSRKRVWVAGAWARYLCWFEEQRVACRSGSGVISQSGLDAAETTKSAIHSSVRVDIHPFRATVYAGGWCRAVYQAVYEWRSESWFEL